MHDSSSDDGQEWMHGYSTEWLETASTESQRLQSTPDTSLPTDLDCDEDLLNPSAWIDKIKMVEARIAANSALQFYTTTEDALLSHTLKTYKTEPFNELEDDSSTDLYPRIQFPAQGFKEYQSLDALLSHTLETYKTAPPFHSVSRVHYFALLRSWRRGQRMWTQRQQDQGDHEKLPKDAENSFTELFYDHESGDSEPRQDSGPVALKEYAHDRGEELLGRSPPAYGGRCRLLRDLLESRNLLIKVCLNVTDLQKHGLCHETISVIISAPKRSRVANLVTVNFSQITKLTSIVDQIVRAIICGVRNGIVPYSDEPSSHLKINLQTMMEHFDKIADTFEAIIFDCNRLVSLQEMVAISLISAHVLDLSVLTYCGAHVEAIDRIYLHRFVKQLEYYSGHLPDNEGVIMRRRSLSCLKSFLHGHRPWVFHCSWECGDDNWNNSSLYLSTSIEAFADTWGPVWKTVNPDQGHNIGFSQNVVQRYNVGLGSIVSWSRTFGDEPTALPEEALCHWTSSAEEIASRAPINADEHPRLLIGGVPIATAIIGPNTDCTSAPEELVLALEDKDCLKPWGTTRSRRYKDADNFQIQVGYHGLNLGYQASYKWIKGTTLKERLVSRWRNQPDRRDPRVLGIWVGLEVSLCTMNARRRPLIYILGTTTCRGLLQKGSFEWADPRCESAYYHAVSNNDHRIFCELFWKHKEWRGDLGKAVSWCLEELLDTGIADGRSDLTALHVPRLASDRSVMVCQKEQSWIGMLKDTEESATMAVASEVCLQFKHSHGQRCRQKLTRREQYSAFQTTLTVVAAASSKEESYSKGHKLPLVSGGVLKMLARLSDGVLLARWSDQSHVSSGWQNIKHGLWMKDSITVGYRECVEDTEPARSQAAIPIIVVSKHENNFQRASQTKGSSSAPTEPTHSGSCGHDMLSM